MKTKIKQGDYIVKLDHDDMIGCIEGSLSSVLKTLAMKYDDKQIAWLLLNGEWDISTK